MTSRQKQLAVRKVQLLAFRRYIVFDGGGSAVYEYLGMNVWELREYVEKQWLTGMAWENYGEVWVVDHVVGLKYFDVFNRKEMSLCWNYNNLKPSFIWDNHAKGYCVEVTNKILLGLPKSIFADRLIEHIKNKEKMFEPYY